MAHNEADLTDVQRTIRDAAVRGAIADFSHDHDEGLADPLDSTWESRSIDGEWLADWIANNQDSIHRRGVRIKRAQITGNLDLDD